MMIKFRAWDKENKQYIQGRFWVCFYDDPPTVAIANTPIHQQPCPKDIEFEQFTGLQDKNGKDIYEGDKVIYGDFEWIGIVKIGYHILHGGGPCRDIHCYGVYFDFGDSPLGIMEAGRSDCMKVIGTIHDKELSCTTTRNGKNKKKK